MVSEFDLKYRGRHWGVLHVSINEAGEVIDIGISTGPKEGKAPIQPFCTAALIQVERNANPVLTFRMYGTHTQTGQVNLDPTGT